MDKNEKKLYKNSYRIGGIKGISVLLIPILLSFLVLGVLLDLFMNYRPGVVQFSGYGCLYFSLLGVACCVLLLMVFAFSGAYLVVDKKGIFGKGKVNRVVIADFSFEWKDIKNISCIANRIIFFTEGGNNIFTFPFMLWNQKDVVAAINTLGGKRVISESSIRKSKRNYYLFLLIIVGLGIAGTGYAMIQARNAPYYIAVKDMTIVDNDVYAVGYVNQGTSETDQPVLWKNGTTQIIGEKGNFNEATTLVSFRDDIYVITREDGAGYLKKNNIVIHELPKGSIPSSMCVSSDTLYICYYIYTNTQKRTGYCVILDEKCQVYIQKFYQNSQASKTIDGFSTPTMVVSFNNKDEIMEVMNDSIKCISSFLSECVFCDFLNKTAGKKHSLFEKKCENGSGFLSGYNVDMEFEVIKQLDDKTFILGEKKRIPKRIINGTILELPIWLYVDHGDSYSIESIY